METESQGGRPVPGTPGDLVSAPHPSPMGSPGRLFLALGPVACGLTPSTPCWLSQQQQESTLEKVLWDRWRARLAQIIPQVSFQFTLV